MSKQTVSSPYSLPLSLIVLGILTDDADNALASDDFALFTAFFDRWFDFHNDNSFRQETNAGVPS